MASSPKVLAPADVGASLVGEEYTVKKELLEPLECPIVHPLKYVAYKLQPGQSLTIDGRLDDPAWEEVAWTSLFIDIEDSPPRPLPRFDTKAKMRYDSEFLYVGAWLEEPHIWGTLLEHDMVIFRDNDFEVFLDPDSSTHWYKEYEINALNTSWDLELNKPYIDGGSPNNSWCLMEGYGGAPGGTSAIYIDGTLNDPSDIDNFWSVELKLPWANFLERTQARVPEHGDVMRINFSRVQWHHLSNDTHYWKDPAYPHEDNWVWSPQYRINMHLPERWGFLHFSEDRVNTTVAKDDPEWPAREALIQAYELQRLYFAQNGAPAQTIREIEESGIPVPDFLTNGACGTTTPKFKMGTEPRPFFKASVRTFKNPKVPRGNIGHDRCTWFGYQRWCPFTPLV